MTAEPKYSSAVQAVFDDYLDRLKSRLDGFPSADREDLLREIAGHIDEAFAAEIGGDEMDRLLRVLRRLGEPSDVISERMSPAMVKMGKKKSLPFYIMSGVLIALLGLPLGAGLFGVLIGVLATILGILVAYYATALSLLVSGVVGIIASVLLLMDPAIIEGINHAFGGREGVHLIYLGTPLNLPPETEALICLSICIILAGVGVLMLWGGRYLLRGIRFLFRLSWDKIQEIFGRKRRPSVNRPSNWLASICN
jgi:uncharacterized membrane protein